MFLVFPEEPLDTSLCARAAIQPQSWADVFRGLVALDLPHRQKGRETGRKIVETYKDVLPLDNAALTQLVEASCQANAPTLAAVWTPMLNTLGLESYANHLRSEMQRTGHSGLSELDNVKAIRLHHERVQARIGIEQAAEPERRSKWIEYTTKYGIEPNDFEAFYNALKADPAYLGTALPIMLRTRHREHLEHYVHALAEKWKGDGRHHLFMCALFSNARMAMPLSYAPLPANVGTPAGMVSTLGVLSREERATFAAKSYVLKGFQAHPESWHPCGDLGCMLPAKGPVMTAVALNVHIFEAMGLLHESDLNWYVEWRPGEMTLAKCLPELRRVIPSEVQAVIKTCATMGLEYQDTVSLACSAMERAWQQDALTNTVVPLPFLEEPTL